MRHDAYLVSLLGALPRILNQMDRNPTSKTFGCCDRDYWHYKVVDFPCARKQEAALTLALIVTIEHPKNGCFRNQSIQALADAAIRYWASMQEKDGSFSEWYPHEHSFVATAFSLYAVTEAVIVSGQRPSVDVARAMRKAAMFLERVVETRVQNQEAGGILALHNASMVLNEPRFALAARKRLLSLARLQHEEGWFKEYGGPDMGYLSLTMEYVGKYHDKTQDETARRIVEKAAGFLRWFVHPDGSVGGVYTSRNTEYLIPSAFEHVVNEDTSMLATVCREGVASGSLPSCRTITDRYLLYNGYTYLQAFIAQRSIARRPDFSEPFEKSFSGCGLHVINTPTAFLVANEKKGGAFFFYGKRTGTTVQDSGISVVGNKRMLSGSFLGSSGTQAPGCLTVTGGLQPVKGQALSPATNVLLRVFQITIGRSAAMGRMLKERLRDRVITPKGSVAGFRRELRWDGKGVEVRDSVTGVPKDAMMVVGAKQAVQYVPSSRLFVEHDLFSQAPLMSKGLCAVRVLK